MKTACSMRLHIHSHSYSHSYSYSKTEALAHLLWYSTNSVFSFQAWPNVGLQSDSISLQSHAIRTVARTFFM